MKHIREIGNQIANQNFTILMQGISGGKAKMKHYFLEKNEGKSILIGLIDTWRDEHEMLEKLDSVIIAKIPFDPPTDPYFLAKTVNQLCSQNSILSSLTFAHSIKILKLFVLTRELRRQNGENLSKKIFFNSFRGIFLWKNFIKILQHKKII